MAECTSFRWVPNGIPGVETRLPLLFSEGVVKKRIDLTHFMRITATNHAKAYGLYPRKGSIAIGADADIAIWDPSLTRTVRHADLHDGSDYTPYEGIEVTGWPVTTLVRGKMVVENGVLVAEKGVRRLFEAWEVSFRSGVNPFAVNGLSVTPTTTRRGIDATALLLGRIAFVVIQDPSIP